MDAGGRATHGAVAENEVKPNTLQRRKGGANGGVCWVSLRSTQPTNAKSCTSR